MEARVPVVAAGLSPEAFKQFSSQGLRAFPQPVRTLLEHAGPLTPDAQRRMEEEMGKEHCGKLPPTVLERLVLLQRARDAQLAERLLTTAASGSPAAGQGGAILIAGSGHVRNDRAVPAFISREAPKRSVVAVAFLEVLPAVADPGGYAAEFHSESLPVDFVVFTPAAEREDPCLSVKR